eukprot:3186108-Amphidinium_carterae.1
MSQQQQPQQQLHKHIPGHTAGNKRSAASQGNKLCTCTGLAPWVGFSRDGCCVRTCFTGCPKQQSKTYCPEISIAQEATHGTSSGKTSSVR